MQCTHACKAPVQGTVQCQRQGVGLCLAITGNQVNHVYV